jgi:hypothetical protein
MTRRPPIWLALLLAISLLVPFPVVLHAAVAHVQTIEYSDSGGDSTTTTTGSVITLTAGRLLVVTVVGWGTGPPVVTNIQLDGTTALTAAGGLGAVGDVWAYQRYLPNVPSGSHGVTVTYDMLASWDSIFLTEISGAATTSPLDGTCATASGNSATPASGNVSGVATSFYIGGFGIGNAGGVTAGSGKTIPTNGISSVATGAMEYVANPGSTPQNLDFSGVSSSAWVAVGCAYKIAAVGPVVGSLRLLGAGR